MALRDSRWDGETNGEIVRRRPLAIDAELSLVIVNRRGQDNSRRQRDQCLKLRPLRGRLSTNVRSITVLTAPESVFTRGAPASTVMESEVEPIVISKSIAKASCT